MIVSQSWEPRTEPADCNFKPKMRVRYQILTIANDQEDLRVTKNSEKDTHRKMKRGRLSHNLRLNKKKLEILTAEDKEEIAGVKCRKTVKYLGLKVATDRAEQRKIAKEQIQCNLNALRWKLKGGEPVVVQQLTCCLARSLLIYIGTPMVVAGLWRR
jgi:hypothetical protein